MPYSLDGVSLPPEAQYDPEELKKLQQQKQQATQAAPQGQAKPTAQPTTKPKKPEQQGPYAPTPLQGVGKWNEEKIGIPLADFVDNVFQGDKKTPDQIARERANQRAVTSEQFKAFDDMSAKDPAAEIIRGVAGGVEDFWEGVVNLPGQVTTLFGNNYKPVRFGLVKENNTTAGDGLRTLTRYVTGGFVGSTVTRGALTAGQTGAALAGGRAAQGFVEGFIGADGTGDDDSFIGSTPFTRWLQTQDTNNPIHNRALIGLDSAVVEAVGIPAAKAIWQVSGVGQAARNLGKLSESYLKGTNKKKLNELLVRVGDIEGLDLGGTRSPGFVEGAIDRASDAVFGPIDRAIEKLPANHWARKGYKLLTGEDIPLSDIDFLLAETRRMLSDPQVLRDQKKLRAVTEYQQAVREAAAPRLAMAAQGRLKELLARQFADDNFGSTTDYTRTTERDLALRLIQEDPQRLRLNALISEAAGTADSKDPIFDYLRQKIEAYPASKQLDDIANTVQYGGPPDEIVFDGMRLPQISDYVGNFDSQIGDINSKLKELETQRLANREQVSQVTQQGGAQNFEIAKLQAELPTLPRLADAQASQAISLSLSKAQVARLQQIQLPEGVTITPGRRVQGLSTENIDEVKAAIAELGASGDQVAANLAARLDNVERPEPIPADFRSQESVGEMLQQLKQERMDLFKGSVEARQATSGLDRQYKEMQVQLQQLQVQREAIVARASGATDQFVADFVPVDMTRKNVTSIVKERSGGQPGFDLYFEDKRFPALLDGKVKEIGRQGNQSAGYGNFVVVESIDPKTGKSVDVLYAHMADGSIKVKEGDLVGVGQQIGTQGGTGSVRSADGTIASVDFLAPAPKGSGSMTPYGRWSQLVDELSQSIQKDGVKPSQVARKLPSVAPEAVEAAAKQAEEIVPSSTRKEAVEAGYEVDELVNARPRNSLVETFDEPLDESVINTAKPGKASLTDMDVHSLANDPQGHLLLDKVVNDIDRELLYTPVDTLQKMEGAEALAKEWLEMTDDEIQKSLTNPEVASVVDGKYTQLSTKGLAANGFVIKELQRQAQDLSYGVLNGIKDGSPEAFKDAERLIERMKAMLQIRTIHKQVSSGKLREMDYVGQFIADSPSVRQESSKLFQELQARRADEIARDQNMYQAFASLQKEIRAGNPKAFKHLERVAQGLAVAVPEPKNVKVMQTVLAAMGKNTDALYVNSILSGPTTQGRNLWGNFYQSTGHPLLAYLGTHLPGKSNEPVRRQAVAAIGATWDSWMEFSNLIGRLYKQQWQALDADIKEYNVWDEALENNMTRVKAMAESGELHWAQQSAYALAITWRKFIDSPFMRPMMALMGATDNFFKIVAARQVASRRAVEDALVDLGDAPLTGKRAEKFAELTAQLKDYHLQRIFSDDGLQIIDEEAIHLGNTFTFQTPIGEADILTKNLNALSSVPFMKTLGITFVKTPSAILKASANLTPGLSTLLKYADKQYKNGSDYYRAMRDGAEAMSYVIATSAFIGGASGTITGAGPLRGENRDTWLTYNKPYTLRAAGYEINYQGLEPATAVLGTFADLGSLFLGGRSETENAWAAILPTIMSNVVNKSYLTQISTLAQLINASSPSDVKRIGENITRGLIPYSGLRNQVGQMVDSSIREMRSQLEPTWDWFIKKQTGLGSTKAFPQQLDPVTGKPMERDGVQGFGGGLMAAMSPFTFGVRFSKTRFEPIHKMLAAEGVDIDNDQRKLNIQDLTNEEMVEYTRLRAGDGQLKKDLLDYFNSPQYLKVDKVESDRQRNEGVDIDKTPAHQNLMSIVRMHHDRAVATMELGLTDVSQGFSQRRQKAIKESFKQEQRLNRTADVLKPSEVINNYPY